MPDPTREALIAAILTQSKLFVERAAYAADLADIVLSEFLVVPLSEITMEYGYRSVATRRTVWSAGDRDLAIWNALRSTIGEEAEAVKRPVLPWSVIPPEEGADS